ncbi:hypothetical protein ARMSODRAFT_983839 [Armillaria solidipes]|uniref:Uncharacterized protein n=1 Tax=Armillaria solidipes TaxID=1076256 RepID=A0A2H3AHP4_9AGAR|nr:hypothetical protein ARMSODRAFT_983839 [Armillaria solidipes]
MSTIGDEEMAAGIFPSVEIFSHHIAAYLFGYEQRIQGTWKNHAKWEYTGCTAEEQTSEKHLYIYIRDLCSAVPEWKSRFGDHSGFLIILFQTDTPSLGMTFGAIYIGATIATVLFGITNLQVVIYYMKYPADWWVYRCSVTILWILDALHVALSTHALYFYLIELFGDYLKIYQMIWSFKVYCPQILCPSNSRRLKSCQLQILINMVIIVGVQAWTTFPSAPAMVLNVAGALASTSGGSCLRQLFDIQFPVDPYDQGKLLLSLGELFTWFYIWYYPRPDARNCHIRISYERMFATYSHHGAHALVQSQELLYPRLNWRKRHQIPTTSRGDSVLEVMAFAPRDSRSDTEESESSTATQNVRSTDAKEDLAFNV